MVSATDHQHRYRYLRTEDGPPVRDEGGAQRGTVDIFYCVACLQYRRVYPEALEPPPQPMGWPQPPSG